MKKKIILILVVIILCLISLSVVDIFNFKDYEIKKISYKETTNQIENSISNDNIDIAEITLDTTTDDNSISQEDNIEIADTSNKNIATQTNNQNTKKTKQKEKTTNNSTTTSAQTQRTNNNITTSVQTQNQQQTTTSQSQNQNINLETKNEKNFIIDTDTINKMTELIKNNESALMKEKGYTIKVNAEIKSLTNGFTFSYNNIVPNLRYKSGVINVYAEYCYENGVKTVLCYMI